MDGIHDLGGMHGFGPIEREVDEPIFHHDWEGRVLGMAFAIGARGLFPIDAYRHAIERMAPGEYLRCSYYERWRAGLERLLTEHSLLTRHEINERYEALRDGLTVESKPPEDRTRAPKGPYTPGFFRDVDRKPRFAVGDPVRARNIHPPGHTRLPRYVRGHIGAVERVYPACVFPDTNAHGRGENPQHVYNVRFDGRTLWGEDAEPGTSVQIDLFESYLEPARENPHEGDPDERKRHRSV